MSYNDVIMFKAFKQVAHSFQNTIKALALVVFLFLDYLKKITIETTVIKLVLV